MNMVLSLEAQLGTIPSSGDTNIERTIYLVIIFHITNIASYAL